MIGPWQLTAWSDNLDTGEDEEGNVQVRHHYVYETYRKELVGVGALTTAVGDTRNSISFQIGGVTFFRTITGGGERKYICVRDGTSPEQPGTPGEYLVREQAWEYYGPWEEPPEGWGIE